MNEEGEAAGRELDLATGSVLLGDLLAAVRTADRAMATAVRAAGRLAGSGVPERIEGLPLELVLANACRLTGSDRGALLTTAEVLRTLPAVTRLFTDGDLSWGQVRRICAAARSVPVQVRAALDARVSATFRAHDGLDVYGPDDLCDRVEDAAADLRPTRAEKAEQRKARGEFLTLQSDLEGGVKGFFALGPVSAAILLNALTAIMAPTGDTPAHDHADDSDAGTGDQSGQSTRPGSADDGDGDGAEAPVGAWTGSDRSRRQARALLALAAASLAGVFASGRTRPARPLFTCLVDLRQIAPGAAGRVVLDVPGPLPTLTARLVEHLGTDATLQAVVFDGHRPLALSRKVHADDLPEDVRAAVLARDGGSRFPGSRRAAAHVHHLVHQEHGGTHDTANLAGLAMVEHQRYVHRYGWAGRADPDSGTITWTRRHRRYRTIPRHTPLAHPPPDPPPRDDGDAERQGRLPLSSDPPPDTDDRHPLDLDRAGRHRRGGIADDPAFSDGLPF